MNEHLLYDEEILLQFDERKHCYTIDGKPVGGVTSVLGVIDKPAINRWKINQTLQYLKKNWKAGIAYDEYDIYKILDTAETAYTLVSDKAKVIGSIVHAWLEEYVNAKMNGEDTPELPVNESAKVGCEAFVKWEENREIEWLASEQVVYSKKYNYAGTFDALARYDDALHLIDFKTSKAVYPEYFIQASTYAKAYEEEHDILPDKVTILKVPKGYAKRPRIYEKSNEDLNPPMSIEELFELFTAALKWYKWQK